MGVIPEAVNLSRGNPDLSLGGTRFPRALEVREKLYGAGAEGQTTRYRCLERREAFYRCKEYDHLSVSWDGNQADLVETISPKIQLPSGFTQNVAAGDSGSILSRRPTSPLRLCPMVVDRFTGLLFSKERTPKVQVEGNADGEDFLQATFKRARFWRTMYLARTYGGSMGSVLVTVQLRGGEEKGRFSYTGHNPKTIQDVVWDDPDLRIPAGVLIQYIFEQEHEVIDPKTGMPSGEVRTVPWLYRRIIDQEADVTFVPQPILGKELPRLEINPHLTYKHQLGRFPGAWVQNLPSDDALDGIPDCEGAYQAFDTIDRQVAQSNKALLQNQDPTLILGRDKNLDRMGVPIKKGSENALNVGQGGTAQYLEISGSGVSAASEFVKLLRQAAMDKCQAVLVDPTQVSGAAQSAKAIEYIYAPMLEKAGRLREQYGEAIEQLADITLAFARRWSDPLQYEGNVRKALFDLPPKVVEDDQLPDDPDPKRGQVIRLVPHTPGKGGVVTVTWGPYFQETPQDTQQLVSIWSMAYTSGGVDEETYVRAVARILKIEDVDAVLKRVREEKEKKQQEMMGQMGGLFPEAQPLEEEGAPSGEVPPAPPPEEPPPELPPAA